MSASLRRPADRLPFFHYWRHSQIGWAERACRNRGMGMCWNRPCYIEKMHGVEVSERQVKTSGHDTVKRTYSTPVGEVYLVELREPGVGQWHAQRSWRDVVPWQTERLIKGPEDYAVVKYMVENTEYIADYFPVEQAMDWIGDDGLVISSLPHSPMQTLMINWIGSEGGRFFFHHADCPELVDDLYHALCESRRPLYEIAAKAPAPIVLCGDNVDAVLVTPTLFRDYFMPVYQEQAELLHRHGKLMSVHMDGRLAAIKELIAETAIDIVEAFHPPPMGDLALDEALATWPHKAVWVGFPASEYARGTAATQAAALDVLRQAGAGNRVTVAASTENLVSNANLVALTSVLAEADLPLTRDNVNRIEQSLACAPAG